VVWGLGIRVQGPGQSPGATRSSSNGIPPRARASRTYKVQGSGFRGIGFRVQGLGLRI
jgi:hypothetical protein